MSSAKIKEQFNIKRKTQKNVIDNIIMGLIALLAALPFSQVYYMRLGFATISSFELIYISMITCIIIKILTRGAVKNTCLPFILFISALVIYLCISVHYDVTIVDYVRHVRFYLPFIVATMLLLVGINITTERYLIVLTYMAILSSASALFLHYLTPSIRDEMLSLSEHLGLMTTHGRLYWENAYLAFFVLLLFLLPRKLFDVNKSIIVISIILTFATLFNTLNRTLLVGYILFCICHILVYRRIRLLFNPFIKVAMLIILGSIIILILAHTNPRIAHLFEVRFLGQGYGLERIFETDLKIGRFPIYQQYLSSVRTHFPIGQGLGRPFHIKIDGTKVFITDVSFIAFLVPFGIFGLIIFCSFVFALYKTASDGEAFFDRKNIRIIKLFLIISLLMSLNYDLYSRNSFVIFVTILVLTLRNGRQHVDKRRS
ncbi:MAG TPA: O-antigen ligase family protein [Defluviitaleaceae bacterium]|nr:O-antigen ligase family protein [Defluviitaleaceae bacterium]